ncbi:MAG: hypothetical protein WCE54_19460 [Ignavibacteriaceae bacterium]
MKYLMVLISLFSLIGCSKKNNTPGNDEFNKAVKNYYSSIIHSEKWQATGTEYEVFIQKQPAADSTADSTYILNISGECPLIQVINTANPYNLKVSNDTLNFSGHIITFTKSSPLTISIDNSEYSMKKDNRLWYIFIDDQLAQIGTL